MARQWVLWNQRDDRPASLETFNSHKYAQTVLDGYRARDARGGRPDLHDVMPHIVIIGVSSDA